MKKLTTFVTHGSIKDGKLVLNNDHYFLGMIHGFEDTPNVRIVIEKERGNKTNAQLRYLYGVVYLLMSDHTGMSIEEIDAAMKARYLKTKMQWRGGELTVIRDKRNLTSDEMSEFIQSVMIEAADLGVVVPQADKDWHVLETSS